MAVWLPWGAPEAYDARVLAPQRPAADLLLSALSVVLLVLLVARAGPPRGDFANYLTAATLWWDGGDLSQLYDYRWFTSAAAATGFGDRLVGFAVLTPPSALFAAPLLWLSPSGAGHVWWVAQGLLLLALQWALSRSLGRPLWWTGLVMLGLWPGVHAHLVQGQIHLPAVLALALGLWGRRWWTGLLWGLAVGLKVHAWPILVLLLLQRRWRAAVAALGTLLAGGLMSVVLLGWPLHAVWLQEVAPAAAGGWFTDPWHPALQSFGVGVRRLLLPSPAGGPIWSARPLAAAALPVMLSAAVVGWTVLWATRWPALRLAEQRCLLAAAAICALVSGPILVTYHLTLLIPPVAWGLDALLRSGQRWRALAVASAAVFMLWTPTPPPPESVSGLDLLWLLPRFWGGMVLWALLLPWRRPAARHALVLCLMAAAAWRSAPPSSGDGVHPLQGGQLPLIAAELMWSEAGGLCWSGLASDRHGHPGHGWVGYCLEGDTPRIVAHSERAHTWAPSTVDGRLLWQEGAVAPLVRSVEVIEGRGQVEVRAVHAQLELFWVPLQGPPRRLTHHPARDVQPTWDPQRQRLWFLSDRVAGVRAMRLWWMPPPWE